MYLKGNGLYDKRINIQNSYELFQAITIEEKRANFMKKQRILFRLFNLMEGGDT